MPVIILASASQSRRRLLAAAGISVTVMASAVDEELEIYLTMPPKEMVLALAIVKAHTIRTQIDKPAIIIACDSTFEFNGRSLGKPGNADIAKERARLLSGNSGYLHTGHCVIDTEQGREITEIASTKVTFSEISDVEIEDYVASGEPLEVAGGFTLDGLSSAFISSIEGDFTNVIGLSIPLLRSITTQLGYSWPDLKHPLIGAER